MAEAIARQWIRSEELGDPKQIFVASAGVAASDGRPIAYEAEQALARLGLDHEGATKPLTAEMIRKAELVLCMTEEHVRAARELVASEEEHEAKIFALDPESDLEDPVGLGQAAYDQLVKRFQKIVPKRLKELMAAKGVGTPK